MRKLHIGGIASNLVLLMRNSEVIKITVGKPELKSRDCTLLALRLGKVSLDSTLLSSFLFPTIPPLIPPFLLWKKEKNTSSLGGLLSKMSMCTHSVNLVSAGVKMRKAKKRCRGWGQDANGTWPKKVCNATSSVSMCGADDQECRQSYPVLAWSLAYELWTDPSSVHICSEREIGGSVFPGKPSDELYHPGLWVHGRRIWDMSVKAFE